MTADHLRPILLVSYDFAPELAGVRRIAGFMRYLPEFGYQPTLLTTTPFCATGWDAGPLREARRLGVEIIRVPSPDPFHRAHRLHLSEDEILAREQGRFSAPARQRPVWMRALAGLARRWLFMPDDRAAWAPCAARAAAAWLKQHPGAWVLTTSFPHSCHLVGLELRRLLGSDLRWVADFRDGWTQNADFFQPPTPWHAARHRALEAEVASRCDLLVSVSPPITAHLQRVGRRSTESTLTILNGFDPEETDRARASAALARPTAAGIRRLVYTGTLFGGRRAAPLFEALRALRAVDPDLAATVKLDLWSRLRHEDVAAMQALEVADMVEERGMAAHTQALVAQMQADALVLYVEPGPRAGIMVTQKLFEYAASRRPIVAAVPSGACADLLRELPQAIVAPADCPETIARAMVQALRSPVPGEVPSHWSRCQQAGQLARACDAASR